MRANALRLIHREVLDLAGRLAVPGVLPIDPLRLASRSQPFACVLNRKGLDARASCGAKPVAGVVQSGRRRHPEREHLVFDGKIRGQFPHRRFHQVPPRELIELAE